MNRIELAKSLPEDRPSDRGSTMPAFMREFDSTLAVHSQYIFHGNIRDLFLLSGPTPRLVPLPVLLWKVLSENGFGCMVSYDQIDGLGVLPSGGEGHEAAAELAKAMIKDVANGGPLKLRELRDRMVAVSTHPQHRAAFLVDYASRLARNAANPDGEERDFFLAATKLAATAPRRLGPPDRQGPLYNPVLWLVDGERDLPPWLTAGNVHIRTIGVPAPDLGGRQDAARLLIRFLQGGTDPAAEQEIADVVQDFATAADGLSLRAMLEVARLAKDRNSHYTDLPDAVRTYKLGVVDNPWRRGYLRRRISEGERRISGRVIGQDDAITKTLDILKRAALGLTGAHAGRSADRPRGTLFFAGPTGVGKTELAKAVAALVFGDESAYLRFDMSEFAAEHAADRLIGAPPGYVGYEAGGELTNAVRQQPFRVILFDEIEKAHERILDKFLQILEDGRLSDGQGQTTYFSESILVFTSNLGVQRWDREQQVSKTLVTPDEPYHVVKERVADGVRDHFVGTIGRPELLNRLGGNIVVFDFIRQEAAEQIFELQLRRILDRVAEEHGTRLDLSPQVHAELRAWCTTDLAHGGRGIGNRLEELFINPLARALFDRELLPGGRITVAGLERHPLRITLR